MALCRSEVDVKGSLVQVVALGPVQLDRRAINWLVPRLSPRDRVTHTFSLKLLGCAFGFPLGTGRVRGTQSKAARALAVVVAAASSARPCNHLSSPPLLRFVAVAWCGVASPGCAGMGWCGCRCGCSCCTAALAPRRPSPCCCPAGRCAWAWCSTCCTRRSAARRPRRATFSTRGPRCPRAPNCPVSACVRRGVAQLLGHLGGAGAHLPGVSDVSQRNGTGAKHRHRPTDTPPLLNHTVWTPCARRVRRACAGACVWPGREGATAALSAMLRSPLVCVTLNYVAVTCSYQLALAGTQHTSLSLPSRSPARRFLRGEARRGMRRERAGAATVRVAWWRLLRRFAAVGETATGDEVLIVVHAQLVPPPPSHSAVGGASARDPDLDAQAAAASHARANGGDDGAGEAPPALLPC